MFALAFAFSSPAAAQQSMRALGGGDQAEQRAATEQTAARPGVVQRVLTDIRRAQRVIQARLADAVRAIGEGGSVWPLAVLLGLSFAYGVVHAAGPGHGKVVIASYLLAGEGNLRRGVSLAAAASFVQALAAIALVGVLAVAAGVSGMATTERVRLLETVSYGIVMLVGLWMLRHAVMEIRAHRGSGSHDHHRHHHHDHGHDALARAASAPFWQAASVVLAVGVRPCSGAVIVLLFALAQGVFVAGVASAFAMSVGTAITVSVLAALSVAVRRGALSLGGGSGGAVAHALSILGALAVTAFGVLFFAASLG